MKTFIELNAENLVNNLSEFHKLTQKKIMFVVKGNAYGHGLKEVVLITKDLPFIDYYSVDSLEEALLIKATAPQSTKKILIIGWADEDQLREIISNGFEMVAPHTEYIKLAGSVARELKKNALLHLKVETGTARMGMSPDEVIRIVNKAAETPSDPIRVIGLYSHFANIEDTTDHSYAQYQLGIFNDLLSKIDHHNLLKHFSCSASTLLFPKTYFDIVRIGISAYGFWPSKQTRVSYIEKEKPSIGLKPVLSWISRVAQVKTLEKGAAVGYGLTYKTFDKSRIIIVPVGYYDGYDRKLSNNATVIVNGIKAPVRGRICMNMFMCDTTHIKNKRIKPGDRVILVGQDGEESVSIDDLAELAGTINYEMIARINPLIPRIIV